MGDYGNVLVAGLGVTGHDVALHLIGRARAVCVYGGPSCEDGPAAQALRDAGADVVCGTDDVEGAYDLAVVSPGIPEGSDFFASVRAHATETIGEPELAWRESPERWVAITGTNGKTTTTTLTRDLLRTGGLGAEAAGNIGASAISVATARVPGTWLVAELSSYQLATTALLHPRVAVLLNVSPDHLSWHGSMERYAAAKERVFANLGAADLAVVSDDDQWCRRIASRLSSRDLAVCHVSLAGDAGTSDAAFVRDDRLVVRAGGVEHALVGVDRLGIKGAHNVQNALAASAAAIACGAPADAIGRALASFSALEHRIEPCGSVGGVTYVNDSKATNVASTLAALTAFAPGTVVLLLGGTDKGTDLAELARCAAGACHAVVCYGEAGPRMADAVRRASAGFGAQVMDASHLADAVGAAADVARAGDTVLLSPACASFDEFQGFEERGRAFKELVRAMGNSGEVA